jgi:hypothetical protein
MVSEFTIIQDILWAHFECMKMFNTFHINSLIDSTYKINRYKIFFIEIACVTTTKMSYFVGFGFITNEKR